MNKYLEYVLKIILYFAYSFVIYFIAKKNKKISYKSILILSIINGLLCLYFSANPLVLDKKLYSLHFSSDIYMNQIYNDSIGLYLIEKVLHIFTYNSNVLFFLISFLFIFIILISYNKLENSKPEHLLLLFSSEFLTYGYYQMKQCVAIALSILVIVEFLNNKKIYTLYLIFALLFHESSFILIPILILLKYSKRKNISVLIMILLLIFSIEFNNISNLIINFINNNIPSFKIQINSYINNDKIIIQKNYFTVLKGLPFFIISLLGLLYKKKFESCIKNYNIYLILSLITSFTFVFSYYMYWMFRFGIYFYFFDLYFFTSIIFCMKNKFNRKIYYFILYMIFFVLSVKIWIQYYFQYGGI